MDQQTALDKIKEIYDDGVAEINGREYKFTKSTHKKRRSVFAFLSRIRGMAEIGDYSFLDWDDFDRVEKTICDMILFDNMQLSKLQMHWEQYPEDYLILITTAMAVISYPLTRAVS